MRGYDIASFRSLSPCCPLLARLVEQLRRGEHDGDGADGSSHEDHQHSDGQHLETVLCLLDQALLSSHVVGDGADGSLNGGLDERQKKSYNFKNLIERFNDHSIGERPK